MSLQDSENLVWLEGHVGRHAKEYHDMVLDRLTVATEGLSGANYKQALIQALHAIRKDLLANPNLVKGQ